MESHKYDDIIDLPHYKSKTRKKMSNYDRAAQFSPFAALTGHSAAIAETARLTDRKRELTEEEKLIISDKLRYLSEICRFDADVALNIYIPDMEKSGGTYIDKNCRIIAIDETERVLRTDSGESIRIDDVMAIDLKH